MENNTLLTGLQELFTNAVKAEVEKHTGAEGSPSGDVESAIDNALNNFEVDFSEFDISDHVDVDDLVTTAVGDIDISEVVCDTLSNYEYPNENRVEEMIEEAGSSGLSMSSANGYFDQVASGEDCSDGASFRKAVLSIVNADKLKNGASVDDGTHMSVKATGTDHEIQAILNRRRSYFEALHHRIVRLIGSAPNGMVPPMEGTAEDIQTWKAAREVDYINHNAENERTALWQVAREAIKLLGLLSGLYNGLSGSHAVRVAGIWEEVASKACERGGTNE